MGSPASLPIAFSSTRFAPLATTSNAFPLARPRKTIDFAICPTAQPIARAASRAVRVVSGIATTWNGAPRRASASCTLRALSGNPLVDSCESLMDELYHRTAIHPGEAEASPYARPMLDNSHEPLPRRHAGPRELGSTVTHLPQHGARMTCKAMAAVAVAALAFGSLAARALAADPNLAGRWTLNRQLSQFPADVGFGMDLAGPAGLDTRGGSGGLPAAARFQESQDDAKRRDLLVEEVRSPWSHLTIAQSDTAVTVTDGSGQSRTFHPTGREEILSLGQLPVATTTRWDTNRLEVTYKVEPNRQLRYTYSRTLDPPQLVVQIRFIERGGRDVITRVYQPTSANEAASPDRIGPPAAPPEFGTPPAGASPAKPAVPAAPPPAPAAGLPQGIPPLSPQKPLGAVRGPDAELKGISQLGVVVEDMGSQASACGLSQGPIEAAVTKSLTDAGLKVMRNADEDTYVYVQIIPATISPGLCVSRYDAFLYTYTTATLSYQTSPVLAQVTLLHKAGIAGGGPKANADKVLEAIKQYADEFAKRIRAANQ